MSALPYLYATLRDMAIKKTNRYSVVDGSFIALKCLLALCEGQAPEEFPRYLQHVLFTTRSPSGDLVCFPTALREQEAGSALKALEACAAAALADLRYGSEPRLIGVDVDRTACFLMSAYLTTINGVDKGNPAVRTLIPGALRQPTALP